LVSLLATGVTEEDVSDSSTFLLVDSDSESVSRSVADDVDVCPVTEVACPGRVADGSEPTVDTGLVPEVVEPELLPDESEFVPVVDDVLVDSVDELVDSVDEPVDPEDELDDSDELEDESESFGAADAAPMPPVPTNPTTPSEKATAPTRSACCAELTPAPMFATDLYAAQREWPWRFSSVSASVGQPDVPKAVVTLTAVPMRVVVIALRDLDLWAVDLARLKRRVAALDLNLVCVGHAQPERQ
jgi:hypothetical protein